MMADFEKQISGVVGLFVWWIDFVFDFTLDVSFNS